MHVNTSRPRPLIKALIAFLAVLSLIAVFPAPASAVSAVPNPTPVFRFYKLTDGSHFFTNSETEKAQVEKSPAIYRYEGIAFYSYSTQVTDSTPVYRFYNFRQGVHFYTNNAAEAANVRATAATTFRDEGIAYYAYSAQVANSLPVFRFYKFKQGVHFYTNNAAEAANIRATASSTYRDEGTSYFLPGLLTFSGTGNGVSESFILPTGLAVFRSTYAGTSTNFVANLFEGNSATLWDNLADEVGSDISVSAPSGVDENRYVIAVQSQGAWTVTVELPKSSVGTLTSFSGTGSVATSLFSAVGGQRTFTYTYNPASDFFAYIYDAGGNFIGYIANHDTGTTGGSAVFPLTTNAYMIGVQTTGAWTINIQ